MSRIFDRLNSTVYNFELPNSWVIWDIAFEPLPTIITQYGDKNGGSSLGTSPKDGNGFGKFQFHFSFACDMADKIKVMLLAALWPNSAFNGEVQKTAQKMTNDIACIAEEMGLSHKFQYINYADPSQDPIDSYGQENVERLREASRKYDQRGSFRGRFLVGLNWD